MSLIWKLLRQNISIPQFVGFFFSNLLGMFIVLFGFQFYRDVLPVFTQTDSFMKSEYVIINKKISATTTLSGRINTFSKSEIADIGNQKFVKSVGSFTSTNYKVDAAMGVNGVSILNTELFFESIPDAFVDAPSDQWHYTPGETTVPVVLPKSYITMYNFGFAQTHSLPKISDGLAGMIDINIYANGNGRHGEFKGKVIGFSSRLSSILVPEAFMKWSNGYFAPGTSDEPTRLMLDVSDPTDSRLAQYIDNNGYETQTDNGNVAKMASFLKFMVLIVVIIGLTISALSFYILMLSIYLLVQKNSYKLENLLLIGYSPSSVARPYQWLTIGLNAGVLIIALALLWAVRNTYLDVLLTLLPDIDDVSFVPTALLGLALLMVVSMINVVVIRHKVLTLWKNKD